MRFHAARQGFKVVATFERGDDAPAGMAVRNILDALGDPRIVLLVEAELAQVVVAVRVKAGTDENHLRLELLKPGHPHRLDHVAHSRALGVGRNREVDHVVAPPRATVRVERVLEKTHHQDAVIAADDIFGAVAVVHVEVHNRDALQAVPLQRVFGGDRHVVEKTEAHGAVVAGMVTGRAHRTESVFNLAGHHRVGGGQRRTGAAQYRIPGKSIQRSVWIDLGVLGTARQRIVGELVAQAAQGGNHHAVMAKFEVTQRSQGSFAPVQRITHTGDQQPIFNRIEPLRTLGVARTHLVFAAIAMGEIRSGIHNGNFCGKVDGMNAKQKIQALLNQLNTVIVGKPGQVRDCVACLLAGGHLLIEDVPGVGKTTLAHALSRSFGLQFSRVQFTADLMPSDLTGVSIYERQKESFVFHPGPVFAQVLLADEINRASPRTQSALLEAMEEKQVTVEGETRPLPVPFFVIATQNPHDQLGTYSLPESQLDRFHMRISLGYPDRAAERLLLGGSDRREMVDKLETLLTPHDLLELQQEVLQVHAAEPLLNYLQDLIAATRSGQWFLQGLSPRAGIAVMRAARAQAFLSGRDYVAPDDVVAVLPQTAAHRLVPVTSAGRGAVEQVRAMLEAVPLP